MAAYVDGFVIPLPKRNLARYRRIARAAGKIWMEYGAVEFRECVADDFTATGGTSFRKLLRLKPNETAIFSWIAYRSKADRKRVTARVMKDPRILRIMTDEDNPFDVKRMTYGGFKTLVDFVEP